MAHKEQVQFCMKIKSQFNFHFTHKRVLDVGSLDINGNNRYLFTNCDITGIDVGAGPNVDVVCVAHQFDRPDGYYETIISAECFEHDMFYADTIKNIIRLLAKGGMFIFTCATEGRAEHGTKASKPEDAPFLKNYDTWGDYYKNLTEKDIRDVIDVDKFFIEYKFEINHKSHDLYFYGIKT